MKINLKLNKLKSILHQCNITLKLKIFCLQEPLGSAKQRYFFVFCVVEEISLVVHGDDGNLGLIIFYVIHLLLCCYD